MPLALTFVRCVARALTALLVDSQIGDIFFGAPQHAKLHGTDHDGDYCVPGPARVIAKPLSDRANLTQLEIKARHQGGDAAVPFSPGNGQLFNSAIGVFELGDTRFDDGLELAVVQVAPLPRGPAIDVGSLGGISWIRAHLAPL